MRRRHRLLAMGLVVFGLATPSFAQRAKDRYEESLARDTALRAATATPGAKEARLVVRALEDVARQHPTSGYSDDALWYAAALASDVFSWHRDHVDQQTAARLLRWLVREYPHSKHNKAAVARLEQLEGIVSAPSHTAPPERAADTASSPQTTGQATPAPASPSPRASSPTSTTAASAAPPAAAASAPPAARSGSVPSAGRSSSASAAPAPQATSTGGALLKSVSRSVNAGVERVAIELEGEVAYREERLGSPSRLFFDLQQTTVTRELLNTVQAFEAHTVRQIRLGKHPNGVTRVVLNLEGEAPYSVFTLYNPYRIVVEFPAPNPAAASAVAKTAAATATTMAQAAAAAPAASNSRPGAAAKSAATSLEGAAATQSTSRSSTSDATPAVVPPPAAAVAPSLPRAPVPVKPADIARDAGLGEPALVLPPAEPPVILGSSEPVSPSPASALDATLAPSTAESLVHPPPEVAARADQPLGAAAPPQAPPKALDVPAAAGAQITAPKAPPANASGGFSLARQLGLGISRVVLDPGHGGHDPGALGKGLTEASATLDIGLRLEKLLNEDGTFEVLMTRRDDVYVPLEERTAIANRASADLFLSIHLNSSRNKTARGFETYYLNFASDPDAEAVAARENSAAEQTMRNLPSIVQAIALNNKLDESKDLASLVQRSLSRRLRAQSKAVRDLGVKRAPFVVLIGASMPSVLAEVSFISHAQEMLLLKTSTYRQRIAQALYDSIVQYRSTLKSTTSVAEHQ